MLTRQHERIAVFVFGVLFVILLIVLALFVPKPTPFQYTVFRIVLALAAAGVAAFIPGFIDVAISNWLRAGGAIAVFVIVYFFSPANLVSQPERDSNDPTGDARPGHELLFVTESYAEAGKDHKELYFTIWNRHPRQRIRIAKFRIVELARVPTVFYCCPEVRSPLTLDFEAQNRMSKPSLETYEIPPLSSNTFVAKIRVNHGIADNNPVVLFGVAADYSTASGNSYEGRSDKIYPVNFRKRDEESDLPSLDRSGLMSFLEKDNYVGREIKPEILDWFPCPWSDSFLPGHTAAFPDNEANLPKRSKPDVRSTAAIAKMSVGALEGYGSLYPEPLDIQVSDLAMLKWSDFKVAFPAATLGCDGKYVLDKYDGHIVRLTVKYTNKGSARTMLDPDWSLSSHDLAPVKGANELLPKDLQEQLISADYTAQDVGVIKTTEAEWIEVKPGHPQTEVLYFKPILKSGKPVYLTDSGLKISLRIR